MSAYRIVAILGASLFAWAGALAQETAPVPVSRSTASVIRNDQIGVCTHFAFAGNGWPVDKMVPLILQTGAGWIRDDLWWGSIEKSKGVYAIPDETMTWINAVSTAGIKIDLILNAGNKIYADHYDPQAYAAAAAWVAKTLAGKIQAIEVLDEPENFGYSKFYDGEQAWSGLKADGSVAAYIAKYVTLINTTAKAVRAANPDIKVLGLGMAPGANFRALAMGIAPEVEGITDHPYSNRTPPELVPFAASDGVMKRDGIFTADARGTFASQIRMYQAQTAKYNGPKEIWLTEQGWGTFQEGKPNTLFAGFTRDAQAKYLLRRLAEATGLGVRAAFIYDLRDDGNDPNNVEHHYGLYDRQSQPKPSMGAVQRYAAAMADFRPKQNFKIKATPVIERQDPHPIVWDGGKLEATSEVKAYQFVDSKGTPLIALWTSERADGDFAPLVGNVEIDTDQPISKITAYDPLSGASWNVPFIAQPGSILMKETTIPDSPVLLTITAAQSNSVQAGP